MKHLWLPIGVLILSLGVIGCSSEANDKPADSAQSTKSEGSKDDSNQENKEDDDSTEAGGTETDSKPPVNSSKEKPKDQENLKLGETGLIRSTLGTAEITINNFKKVNDIKGAGPQLDYFFISEIEIKNVGDKEIDTVAWMDILEMAWDLDAAGSPDDSGLYEVQALSGKLAPGETAKGEVVFDVEDTDQYYFMVSRAMVAGGNVFNNAMWSFKKNEVK